METIVADNQPSFNSGVNVISEMLNEPEVQNYLRENGIKILEYKPYPSGASFLGGAVESLIQHIKQVLYSSVGKRLLNLRQFEFVVAEAQALVNKRPIAWKEKLSANDINDQNPFSLSPEMLITGYDVPFFNILPMETSELQDDLSWEPCTKKDSSQLYERFNSLSKARESLHNAYEVEFLRNLEKQATNKPNRYKKGNQQELHVGDIVAVKTKLLKPFHYPQAIVTSLEFNDLGEINAINVRKANGSIIRRHPCDIIPLLSNDIESNNEEVAVDTPVAANAARPQHKAAQACNEAVRSLAERHLT